MGPLAMVSPVKGKARAFLSSGGSRRSSMHFVSRSQGASRGSRRRWCGRDGCGGGAAVCGGAGSGGGGVAARFRSASRLGHWGWVRTARMGWVRTRSRIWGAEGVGENPEKINPFQPNPTRFASKHILSQPVCPVNPLTTIQTTPQNNSTQKLQILSDPLAGLV